jgi:hypothetical protein
MILFNTSGKLEHRKCIGHIRQSQYKAAYILYIHDKIGEKPHTYIEISYAAVRSANREPLLVCAKRMALSKGINLVEVY